MRVLAALLFVVGILLLAGLSLLIVTGDEALLGQIGLGVWAMNFFLAAIFLKVAEGVSKATKARTETREDGP
ncbi:MAG: hypothetical protein WKF67_12240 [Rubrobacteraceae bacterium]